jgi:hypothetical protein
MTVSDRNTRLVAAGAASVCQWVRLEMQSPLKGSES